MDGLIRNIERLEDLKDIKIVKNVWNDKGEYALVETSWLRMPAVSRDGIENYSGLIDTEDDLDYLVNVGIGWWEKKQSMIKEREEYYEKLDAANKKLNDAIK